MENNKIVTKWNRLGYIEMQKSFGGLTYEKDWNQTLLTMINQTQVVQLKQFAGDSIKSKIKIDLVITSEFNRSLFNTLEYFDKEKNTIGDRYKVQFRSDFPDSLIIVANADNINDCGYVILENISKFENA